MTILSLVYVLNIHNRLLKTYDSSSFASLLEEMWSFDQNKRVYKLEELFPLLQPAFLWLATTIPGNFVDDAACELLAPIAAKLLVGLDARGSRISQILHLTDKCGNKVNKYLTYTSPFPLFNGQKSVEGHAALAYACYFNVPGAWLECLLDHYPDLSKSSSQLTLDTEKLMHENASKVTELRARWEGTSLDIAISNCNTALVKLLVDRGADLDDDSLYRPISLLWPSIYMQDDDEFYADSLTDNFDFVGILELLCSSRGSLRFGPTVMTPLQIAVLINHYDLAALLLDAGIDINGVGDGETIVAYMKANTSRPEEIQNRIERDNFKTPLKLALQIDDSEDIAELLRERGGIDMVVVPAGFKT